MPVLALAHGHKVNEHHSQAKAVSLPQQERLRHLYCIGSTGSGKSFFAEALLLQDIRNKTPFGLIEPEGELYERCIRHHLIETIDFSQPIQPQIEALAEQMVLIEPSRLQFSLPLNVLRVPKGIHPYTTIDETILAFKKAWHEAWGARLEDILRNSLLLLQEFGLTLAELPRLLSEKDFRESLAKKSTNPDVKIFWLEHLKGIKSQEYRYWIESTRNKVSAFVSSPFIKPMISQQDCLDFQELMDSGKTCLIHISQKHLKESGSLLGMLFVSRIALGARGREVNPETPPWYLYVDEFQNYATETFLDLITAARKTKLGLALFHQNLSQRPFDKDPAFIETILSNAHTLIVFSLSRKDAQRLAPELFEATGEKVKTRKRHWVWGAYGEPKFWSVKEEWEHYYSQLQNQKTRECFIKMKWVASTMPFACHTFDMARELEIDQKIVEDFKQASFEIHSTKSETVNEQLILREQAFKPEKAKVAMDYGEKIDPPAQPK